LSSNLHHQVETISPVVSTIDHDYHSGATMTKSSISNSQWQRQQQHLELKIHHQAEKTTTIVSTIITKSTSGGASSQSHAKFGRTQRRTTGDPTKSQR
jgi:hypothetical protein